MNSYLLAVVFLDQFLSLPTLHLNKYISCLCTDLASIHGCQIDFKSFYHQFAWVKNVVDMGSTLSFNLESAFCHFEDSESEWIFLSCFNFFSFSVVSNNVQLLDR